MSIRPREATEPSVTQRPRPAPVPDQRELPPPSQPAIADPVGSA